MGSSLMRTLSKLSGLSSSINSSMMVSLSERENNLVGGVSVWRDILARLMIYNIKNHFLWFIKSAI